MNAYLQKQAGPRRIREEDGDVLARTLEHLRHAGDRTSGACATHKSVHCTSCLLHNFYTCLMVRPQVGDVLKLVGKESSLADLCGLPRQIDYVLCTQTSSGPTSIHSKKAGTPGA